MADASQAWDRLQHSAERCLTTNFVIDETLTLIGRRAGNRFAGRVGRRLYRSRILEIHRPSLEDEITALGLLEKYADQGVSFTDCVSFVTMRARGIERAFGFDRHFRIAGFDL